MFKEIIIVLIIITSIITLDYITQEYTKESVEKTSRMLSELKQEIKNEGINKKGFDNIVDEWDKSRIKLAYFIEHNELEKVETNLTNIKSSIETGQQESIDMFIDETIFILEHIKDKNSFNLENIF